VNEHYKGNGGPIDKAQDALNRQPGQNDNDVVPARVPDVQGLGGANDIATQGQQTSRANVGKNPSGPGGSKFKGEDYFTLESVPDSISAEGFIPPASVTESSRETEGYSQR
jgi:hypothetical protein